MYNGVTNTEVSIFVENTTPIEPLLQISSSGGFEGTPLTYQVALSTAPAEEVVVELQPTWLDGIPRNLTISPSRIVFPAGQPKQWQTVTIDIPYTPAYLGEGSILMTHTFISDDPFFDSSSGSVGMEPMVREFQVEDLDSIGVCLTNCSIVSKFNFIFTTSSLPQTEPIVTPYEVVDGQVLIMQSCTNPAPTAQYPMFPNRLYLSVAHELKG